jgi:hypothetical protein
MTLDDLKPAYVAKLRERLKRRTTAGPDGCRPLMPGSQSTSINCVRAPMAHLAWLLRHGELPTGSLRWTCTTATCCNPDHLVLRTPLPKTGSWRRLTAPERCEAVEMRRNRKRMRDIAEHFNVTVNTISRIIANAGGRP